MRLSGLLTLMALAVGLALAFAGCATDPTGELADSGPIVCVPMTAIECTGDNACKGGELCINGTNYGSCQCLDEAGVLLVDGEAIVPVSLGGGPGDGGPFFPDVGSADAKKEGGAVGTTCDNSETVAPLP